MTTTYCKVLVCYICVTLTLRQGSVGSGDVVVRNGGFQEYCEAEEFHATCSQNEVIYMQNALYGRMRTGRCVDTNYGYVGCGKDVLHLADWMCSGRPSCRIPVPNSAFKKATDCPNDLKPYFQAGFECLRVETGMEQNCKPSSYILPSATSGYLSNYVTIETGKGSAECPWMIQGLPGQKVNLTVYDFARRDLRSSMHQSSGTESICRVYALIREKGETLRQTSTVCRGNGRVSHAYLSTSHQVEVRILSKNDIDNKEFFLIKYEIIGCPDPAVPTNAQLRREDDAAVIECPLTNQKWRLLCDGNTWSGSYGNCSQETEATFGEIVWGNLFMSFEVSLTIVVGIAIGIGIVILACGVICIRSTCKPKKKKKKKNHPRKVNVRPVNTVPPQRTLPKRPNGTTTLPKPPPRSPGIIVRKEDTHGPLPPPPSFLMDKDINQIITENEYSYISDMPPPPPSPTPAEFSPIFPDPPGMVLANPMTSYHTAKEIDSDPDYTSPPTPYTSPRHTHYDVGYLRSNEDNMDSLDINTDYFYKNKYSSIDPSNGSNFSMKIYSKEPSGELPPYYETDPDENVPCDSSNGEATGFYNCGSLQSRYWRNKNSGMCVVPDDRSSLHSKTGTL